MRVAFEFLFVLLLFRSGASESCEYDVSVQVDGPLGLTIGLGLEILDASGVAETDHDGLKAAPLQAGDRI
eukprot:2229297-Prorocentrum_lima.AAC.1